MSSPTSWQQQSAPCVICSGPTNGIWHYGVECCRACASFFHRSMKERRDYSCRNRRNCIINHENALRNSCRACRLKKCLELGMVLTEPKNTNGPTEKDEDPPLPSLNFGSSSSHASSAFPPLLTPHSVPSFNMNCSNNYATSSTAMESSSNLPETQNLLNSIRQFEHGIRAFAIVEGLLPDMIGGENKFKSLSGEEFLKLDKGVAMLACVMVVEYMPEVSRFPKEIKYKFFKYFAKPFTFIHRAKMTEKVFPDPTSPYVVMIPGGVLDNNSMKIFLDGYLAKAKPEQREKFRRCFIKKHIELGKKQYQSLHISDREFAVITGLMFWRAVEHIASDFVPPSSCGAKRDAFYVELGQIISEELQQKQHQQKQQISGANSITQISTETKVAIRFGKLVDFLHQMAIFEWEVNELTEMAKIFMDLPDMWDEMELTSTYPA